MEAPKNIPFSPTPSREHPQTEVQIRTEADARRMLSALFDDERELASTAAEFYKLGRSIAGRAAGPEERDTLYHKYYEQMLPHTPAGDGSPGSGRASVVETLEEMRAENLRRHSTFEAHRAHVEIESFSDASADFRALYNPPEDRTRAEHAGHLNAISQTARDAYEHGATVYGDVLVIPRESIGKPTNADQIRAGSHVHAVREFTPLVGEERANEVAAEFVELGRAIAGRTADGDTRMVVFQTFYNEIKLDASTGKFRSQAAQSAQVEPTLERMRVLARAMRAEAIDTLGARLALGYRAVTARLKAFAAAEAERDRLDDEALKYGSSVRASAEFELLLQEAREQDGEHSLIECKALIRPVDTRHLAGHDKEESRVVSNYPELVGAPPFLSTYAELRQAHDDERRSTRSILAPLVSEVVVSHPRTLAWIAKDTNKTNAVDARKLADLLRLYLVHPVYCETADNRRTFKHLVTHYEQLSAEQARLKAKIKARLRALGVIRKDAQVFSAHGQAELLELLTEPAVKQMLAQSFAVLNQMLASVKEAKQAMMQAAAEFPEVRLLETAPGVGIITACRFVAYAQTPRRISNKRKLWRYAPWRDAPRIKRQAARASAS